MQAMPWSDTLQQHGLTGLCRRCDDQPRWPLPMGTLDPARGAVIIFGKPLPRSMRRRSLACNGAEFSNRILLAEFSDGRSFDVVDLEQGEVALALFGGRILPEMVSPVRRLKRRIWLGRHRCRPGRPGRSRLRYAGSRSHRSGFPAHRRQRYPRRPWRAP